MKFYLLSKIFITLRVLLDLLMAGVLVAWIIACLRGNWFDMIWLGLGLIVLTIEVVKLCATRVVIYPDYLLVNLPIYRKSFYLRQKKIVYQQVKEIEFSEAYPVLKITFRNSNVPVFVYLKQFSRHQIVNIINELGTHMQIKRATIV